jgi:hypothetical protein
VHTHVATVQSGSGLYTALGIARGVLFTKGGFYFHLNGCGLHNTMCIKKLKRKVLCTTPRTPCVRMHLAIELGEFYPSTSNSSIAMVVCVCSGSAHSKPLEMFGHNSHYLLVLGEK